MITEAPLGPEIDAHVRHLIKASGLSLKTFAQSAGMKNIDALKWWVKGERGLTFNHLKSLSQYLGVSIEDLARGSYDIALIRQRLLGKPETLPEAYSQNAASYVRTSAHIVEYLSILYGRRITDGLLKSLNIHPLFFSDMNNKISINFYVDIFDELSRMGLLDDEIASLACYIFLKLRDTNLGNKFKSAKDYQGFFEILAENAGVLETNFTYELQFEKEKFRILATPTDATKEMIERDPEKYQKLFQYRKNVFTWFPTLGGLSPLSMKTPKCVLRGDPQTVYEATLLPPNSKFGSIDHLKLL